METSLQVSPGRLKRQISSQVHTFAVVCPPGFEEECLAEAQLLGLNLVPDTVAGAVIQWTGKLPDLYKANLFLRCASRILVRLDTFHAGAREELFRKVLAFPWELWLSPNWPIRVDAHLEYARISHEGMTSHTTTEAITRRMAEAGQPLLSAKAPGDALQRIQVRINHNQAEISLDSSGDHLHKRGWRLRHGAAPLRENLAAGLLCWAGWPGNFSCLVDGMTGSGTFPIEARALVEGRPASHHDRDFAFKHWPSFANETFGWLQKQRFYVGGPGEDGGSFGLKGLIYGNEIDCDLLALSVENEQRQWGNFTSHATDAPSPPKAGIQWSASDFFQLSPPVEGPGLLVLNPPYGIRLSDGQGTLRQEILNHVSDQWRGWKVLILGAHDDELPRLPKGMRPIQQKVFRHGGLRIGAWLYLS